MNPKLIASLNIAGTEKYNLRPAALKFIAFSVFLSRKLIGSNIVNIAYTRIRKIST
jgi:hypothetical protein